MNLRKCLIVLLFGQKEESTMKKQISLILATVAAVGLTAYRPKAYAGQELENIKIEGKAVAFTHWF